MLSGEELIDDDKEKAIVSFYEFHQMMNDDICLDMDERSRILDAEATAIIKKICSVGQCTDLQNFEKDKKHKLLKALKNEGLSTRQVTRLTGISRNIF